MISRWLPKLILVVITVAIVSFLSNGFNFVNQSNFAQDSSHVNINPQYLISFKDVPTSNDNNTYTQSHIQAFDAFMDKMSQLDSRNKLVDKFIFPVRGVNLTKDLRDELIKMSQDPDNIYGIIGVELNGIVHAFPDESNKEI